MLKMHTRPWLNFAAIASAAVWIGAFVVSPRAGADSLHYTFAPDPQAHTLRVTLEWRTEAAGPATSALAIAQRWASVDQPARFIRDFSIAGGELQPQDRPGRWEVRHDAAAAIRVEYTVDAGHASFDWDRRYLPIVSHKFFHGIGETFLLTPDLQHESVRLRGLFDISIEWDLPAGWNRAATSLGSGRRIQLRTHPMVLRQAAFLAGSLDIASADADGRPNDLEDADGGSFLTVAMHDLFAFDAPHLARVCARILEAQRNFMADDDLPPFTVLLIPVGDPLAQGSSRLAGTGLNQSIALFLPPRVSVTDQVIMLIAHEMFHHWNGRVLTRIEPEELAYWFSEGFTDYYAMRVLLERFPDMHPWLANWLNGRIATYYASPAINATNQEIHQRFWSGDEPHRDIPYARGLMLGVRWHHLARENGVEDGLDALMRELMRRARERDYQLANQTFREIGIQALGEWFGEEFDRYVDRAETVPLEPDFMQPWFDGELGASGAFELGFDWEKSKAARRVRGLKRGSAAAEAGLEEGDQLLGWVVTEGDANQRVELTVQRGRQVLDIAYMPRDISSGRQMVRFRAKGG